MSLHGRYTNGIANDQRTTIKFRRADLLWKTTTTIVSPDGQHKVKGLPIREEEFCVGPTILDMMVREVVPVTPALRKKYALPKKMLDVPVWRKRDLASLWPGPARPRASRVMNAEAPAPTLDHPFQAGLASGGRFQEDEDDFVRVDKMSTVSISSMAMRLAVGMTGSVSAAYTHIGKMAVDAWSTDLQRSSKLWQLIVQAGQLVEDEDVERLRPISSVSQEVERLIMRQACSWLGVDPDLDCARRRGRPREASAEAGSVIRITVTPDERLHGELIIDFNGISVGTRLDDLSQNTLVELLGALRLGQFEFDAELVEAFLDAAAPDWRAEATAQGQDEPVGHRNDPYEILGVATDAPMEDVTKAYRKTMQKVHPDVSTLGPWFAQMVSEAYRNIRLERGENDQT
jgi:hypothetical protein